MAVNAGEKSPERVIPRNLEALRSLYRMRLKRLQKRFENGKSSWAIGRKLRLDHKTVLTLIKHPERPVSRKTMIKVIQGTTGRKRKRFFRPPPGCWFPDAI
jgi:hypothetical protein